MTVGETAQYHFDKVGVSAAIKTLLKSNGIDLNFNLKDVDVGGLGGLGELVSSSLPLLVLVTSDVVQNGNDFTIGLSFEKIYELLKSFVDLSALPEAVTKLLPKDMTIKAVLHTDGKILTGIDVVDSVMTTNDGAGDGTFNLTSRFNLFGAPAESLNVESMVPNALKALPARKILNVDTYGDILFEKTEPANPEVDGSTDTVVTTRILSWHLAANLDLFKAMESNFILEDEIFHDNFLHFQLKMDGEPILDFAFSPATLNTNDLVVGANVKIIANTLLPDLEIMEGSKLGDLLGVLLGENYFIPISTKALGYMLSGKGGAVEKPLPMQSWANPAKYESLDNEVKAAEESGGIDLGAVIDVIGKVVSIGNGELKLDVARLFEELKLDASVTDFIGNLTDGGETARFTNTVFEFSKEKTEHYNVIEEIRKGKYNAETGEYAERPYRSVTGFGSAIDFEVETDEGFLKIYNGSYIAENSVQYGKAMRISLEELNAFISNTDFSVRYTGHDIGGNSLRHNPEIGLNCSAMITGYIDLDPTLIGKQQTVEFLTGIPGFYSILSLLKTLGNTSSTLGFDLTPIIKMIESLKFGTFKAEIILSEANYEVGFYSKETGKEFGEDELPNLENADHISTYELRAKTTYYANDAFAEEKVDSVSFSSASVSDWLQSSLSYKELCVAADKMPLSQVVELKTQRGKIAAQGEIEFPIYYKGMIFEKVYKTETATETTYSLNSGKEYFRLGSTVRFGTLWQYFNLKSVYAREGGNLVCDYRLYMPTWNELEFVNIEELTDVKIQDINVNDTSNFSIRFTKSGLAKFNVKFNGVLMTTVEIPVLPDGENPVVSDAVYSSVAGAETTKLSGTLSFDLKDKVLEAYRTAALSVGVTDNNGAAIPDWRLSVNGGESNVFELSDDGAQSVSFEISNLPAGTYRVNVNFKITYADMKAFTIVTSGVLPLYNEFKATSAFNTFKFGSAIPNNSLTFSEFNQINPWKISFANGKYVLKRTGSDEVIELKAEMLSAEQNPVVIEGGIDESGKIVSYGTLRVSFEYNAVVYEITRAFGGLVESGDFDTFAFGEAIPDGSFVVYAPNENKTYTFTLYGNIRVKKYYMQSNAPIERIACTVAVYDAQGNAISGAVDTKTGQILKYGLLKVSFTVDGVDYEFTRAFNGLEKSESFDTFAFGEAVPDGSLSFTDAAKKKSYSLKFVAGAYAFFNGETAVGATEAVVADAEGNVIDGGIGADGKVVKSGTLKIKFTLDKTDYEIVREITEPETPVA